ncbi:unnamed protein product, partial [Heterotrigona itama]
MRWSCPALWLLWECPASELEIFGHIMVRILSGSEFSVPCLMSSLSQLVNALTKYYVLSCSLG